VGIIVGDVPAAMTFYGDVLGFSETWRGSRSGTELSWINMRVPDGGDYVEFMLYGERPAPSERGTQHHICHLPGGGGPAESASAPGGAAVPGLLFAAVRAPRGYEPEAPAQPLRPRRHPGRADGARNHGRPAGASSTAPHPRHR
jgi:catechol 2,3-dioxygenase-like lactoylglutathione lyase family enzyme